MINNLPSFVSVIIPCRNEEKFIERCLDSILNQDYPKDKLEILIIDGMSEDKTREIINKYIEKCSFVKLSENHKKFTPFGLNIGIKEAKGEIVMRMDAHATYEKDYISKCVRYLGKYEADNVGGVIKTIPKEDTLIAKAIAFCMSCSFGVGGSVFRTGSKEVKETDTVFGGCYKKEIFDKVGLFNEKLLRSQDIELNLRIKRNGGKIILAPDIVSYYYPKDNLIGFLKHNFLDGVWSTYPAKVAKIKLKLRHYIPLVFVLSLFFWGLSGLKYRFFFHLFALEVLSYLLSSFYFSYKIGKKENDSRYFLLMPIVFAVRHFAYGIGSIFGLIKRYNLISFI